MYSCLDISDLYWIIIYARSSQPFPPSIAVRREGRVGAGYTDASHQMDGRSILDPEPWPLLFLDLAVLMGTTDGWKSVRRGCVQLDQPIWRQRIEEIVSLWVVCETVEPHGRTVQCSVSQLTHSTIDVLSDHERGARYQRQDRIAFDVLVLSA